MVSYVDAVHTHTHGHTATHVAVCPRVAMYGAISRRTSMQDTADAKLYATYHNLLQHVIYCSMLRLLMYDDTMCVNAAVEINMLDYNIAVCQRTAPGT